MATVSPTAAVSAPEKSKFSIVMSNSPPASPASPASAVVAVGSSDSVGSPEEPPHAAITRARVSSTAVVLSFLIPTPTNGTAERFLPYRASTDGSPYAPVMPASALEAARQFREEQGWEVLAGFADLLRLPNVTGSVDDLRRNARLGTIHRPWRRDGDRGSGRGQSRRGRRAPQ